MNIRERNMAVAIWFLGLVASVAMIGCIGLASKLGHCERERDKAQGAYEALVCSMGGCQ